MNYHKNIAMHLNINPQSFDGDYVNETEKTIRITGTYLHGQLQSDNRYDIFGIYGNLPTSVGIYPAKIASRENDECTFFLWIADDNMTHGLVVLNTDTDAMKYAQSQYENRTPFL